MPLGQIREDDLFLYDQRFYALILLNDARFLYLAADFLRRPVKNGYLVTYLHEEIRNPVHMARGEEMLDRSNGAALALYRRCVSGRIDIVDKGRYTLALRYLLEDYPRAGRHGQEDHPGFHT